ncbi:hypothetical protein ACFLSJ_03525 [Verrucomicrobiota bacterium]
MPSYFISRMQFGLHQDPEEVAATLLQLVRRAPIDEIMLFSNGVQLNNGYESLEEKKEWMAHSRVYRRALESAGITVSFNPPDTLHVCDPRQPMKEGQDWNCMEGPDGERIAGLVCQLDADWQRYIIKMYELYAREGFGVIWVDDDFRLHNHPPLEWSCFCPLHVEAFNERAGVKATREEIVANCSAPGPPHPWRGIWLDMWDETMTDLLERIREAVQRHGSRLGLMSSCPSVHSAEGRRWDRWWHALSGDRPPIHRPHFWPYSETDASFLPNSIALLDQNRRVQPSNVDCKPEIDCYPYGRWNKSFRQIGAQMALAHVLGATGLNISVYDFMGNDPDDEPERAEFLKLQRPICDWLADTFPMALRSRGVGLPWSPDVARHNRTDGSGTWRSITTPGFGWDAQRFGWPRWLGGVGHAFSMAAGAGVNALPAPEVWASSQGNLESWLAGGVLLDGPAASAMIERGMGEHIGFARGAMVATSRRRCSVENVLDGDFGLRADALMGRISPRDFEGEPLAGCRIVSDLRGPRGNVAGHGVVLFENSLGGRVATVPWCCMDRVGLNACRADQLTGILRFLDPENCGGYVKGGAWLVPQFLTDGYMWRGVVWNASADSLSSITLHPPKATGMPAAAIAVHADAGREDVAFVGQELRMTKPLQQWEFVVLIW